MIKLSIEFPEDEFDALCEHLKTSALSSTEHYIMLRKAIAYDEMTLEQADNVRKYLREVVEPQHKVISALLSACLRAKERKILT